MRDQHRPCGEFAGPSASDPSGCQAHPDALRIEGIAGRLADLWRADGDAFDVEMNAVLASARDCMPVIEATAEHLEEEGGAFFMKASSCASERVIEVEDRNGDRALFQTALFALPISGRRAKVEAFLRAGGPDLVARAMSVGRVFAPLANVKILPEAGHLHTLFPEDLHRIHSLVLQGGLYLLGAEDPGVPEWPGAMTDWLREKEPDPESTPDELAQDGGAEDLVLRYLFGQMGHLVPVPDEALDDGGVRRGTTDGTSGDREADGGGEPEVTLTGDACSESSTADAREMAWLMILCNVHRRFGVTLGAPNLLVDAQDIAAGLYARRVIEIMLDGEEVFGPPGSVVIHLAEDRDEQAIHCAVVHSDRFVGHFELDDWLVPSRKQFVRELLERYAVVWHDSIHEIPGLDELVDADIADED